MMTEEEQKAAEEKAKAEAEAKAKAEADAKAKADADKSKSKKDDDDVDPDDEDSFDKLPPKTKAAITRLRNENAKYRTSAKEANEKLTAIEAERKAAEEKELKEKGEFEKLYKKAESEKSAMSERVIRAEIKAVAIKEGLIDMDLVGLIDISKLKIGDDGDIEGVADAVKAFKKAKPHLFETKPKTTQTGSDKEPGSDGGNGGSGGAKEVGKMDAKEYAAWKKEQEKELRLGHLAKK